MPSQYRVSPARTVRFMGAFLVMVGVLVFLLAALVGLLGWSITVLSVGVVVAVAAVLGVGILVSRAGVVVRLDDTGYQVRYVRGAGVTRARWTDVEDVVTGAVADEPVVVLRLRDGRTTTIPVNVLAGNADDFVRDLQQHLQRGHGYRRLR